MAQRCAGAACGIAMLALAGWLGGARLLAGQWGGAIPMAPSTALAFLFLGGGLFSHARWFGPRLGRLFALASAGLPAGLGLLALAQFATGFDSGVERTLARTNELFGHIPLGRMSPLTAASFLLESGALMLLLRAARWRFAASLAALLALAAAAINLVVVVGYAYGAPLLYGGVTIPVALPTALAFVLIGAGQIGLALPGVPAARAWRGDSMRGLLLRAFLPAMLALILLAGWLDVMQPAVASLNPALWHSLTALLACVLIVAIAGWTARRTGDAIERAREALEKNRRLLAETERMGNVGGWELDIDTGEQVWTEAAYQIHEVDMAYQPTLSKGVNFYAPGSRPIIERAVERAIQHGEPFDLELEIITAKGNLRSVHAVGKADPEHRKVIGFIQDITGRKRAEEALREASALTQILLDSMPTVALLMRPHSREIVASNRAAVRIGAVPGTTCFATWAGRDAPCPWCLAPQVWATGEEQHLEVEHQGVVWDAHWIPVSEDLYMHYAFDITERKLTEAKLAQAQKMESIGRLAGGVAHDFNNLLTVINGYSLLLLGKLNAADPLRASIEQIHKAGERAAGLTSQLLAFSRKQVLEPRVLDLNRVVGEMRPMLERLVGEDVQVRVELSKQAGMVHADPHQIEQVIMNLVVNARDAMPQGGKLLIETDVAELDSSYARSHPEARAGRYVLLAVSDTGVGMDPETRRQIFEPFFTTKGAGKGTGLGLSMVEGIVAQSGGHIQVYSEPGQGTTFRVYLPSVEDAAPVSQSEAAAALGGEETVLVVEDQAEVREYAVTVLKAYGYRVIQAGSAAQALLMFEPERGRIDLVLTDVVMPKVGGPELAGRLEKLQPGIKVLFMSGYTDNVIVHHGVLEEGAQFIQKPFSPEQLAARVREVLGPPKPLGRILVADDEAGVRGSLRATLEQGGYEVIEAEDGKQALRRAREGGVDLVITDLVMPEQEGIETIRALRKEIPDIGIIAISGKLEGPYLKMATVLGADAALAKPLAVELL
ncbi:MAG: response regulator, partial [Bryobacterales bacterium]|nr:response regulator [Bryobacterales bacterium]